MCKEGRTKEGRVSNYHTGKWNSVYGGFRIIKSCPEGVLGFLSSLDLFETDNVQKWSMLSETLGIEIPCKHASILPEAFEIPNTLFLESIQIFYR